MNKNILKILNFVMDTRTDQFLSLIVQFIQNSIPEWEANNRYGADEIAIEKIIQNNFHSFLPNIMNNGLNEFDSENQVFEDLDAMFNKPILPILMYKFLNAMDFTFEASILNLIFKCFSQRSQIIKCLKNTKILTTESEIDLFDYIKKEVIKMKFICEQSEVWLVTPEKMNSEEFKFKFLIYKLIDILRELDKYFYIHNNQEINNVIFPEMNATYNVKEVSSNRQNLMKNLKAEEIIINLLKDADYILEKIEEKDEENKSIVEIFEFSYKFLFRFCSNNKKNKKVLFKYMSFFLKHLDYLEVGQTNLVCEIYKNCFTLSSKVSEDEISTFFSKICEKNK